MVIAVLFRNQVSRPQRVPSLKSRVSLAQNDSFPILPLKYKQYIINDFDLKIMGNNSICCGNEERHQRPVTYLPNNCPAADRYRLVKHDTVRFSEISVRRSQRNKYIFTMGIKDQSDVQVEIPVINELIHSVTCQNYQLKLDSRMIIDGFNKRYEDTLIDATNQKTGEEFSMKIVPFKSYTSSEFKRALYELWLHKVIGRGAVVRLMDYFIYGMNEEEQGFVLLFERCITNLANIAEYRKEARYGWMNIEKLKVFDEVLMSYQSLYEKNIIHRDLRPQNIFYVSSTKRFAIGNLSRARYMRSFSSDDDLLTVEGIPHFSCKEVEKLMNTENSIGYYKGLSQDYAGLNSVLKLLETCQILDRNPEFQSEEMDSLHRILITDRQFPQILNFMKSKVSEFSIDRGAEIGDKQIAKSCSYLLAHTHKLLIEEFVFRSFGYLGYTKQFTSKAHRMLEVNSQNQRQCENAPILKKLGEFYESKGSKGTQYYYNAFILYIKRSETQLKYGYPDKADYELDQAKETYLKLNQTLESELPRIQINRVMALLQLQNQHYKQAIEIIKENFVKAAQQNIPIEKQCKILLAYGKIMKVQPDTRNEAEKKLFTGLNICENSSVFESPSSCRIFKSCFLYEIGTMYLDEISKKHNPKKHRTEQSYDAEMKGKAEGHLKSSLQIREKEAVDEIDVAQCLTSLGMLSYVDENFFQSKNYFLRALIRMNHMKDSINPLKFVNGLYMKGSACYYLEEFEQAEKEYGNAVKVLQVKRPDQFLLKYNIEGNQALAMIQMNQEEGKIKLEEAMKQIKQIEGEMSYDYACLKANYQKILKEKE